MSSGRMEHVKRSRRSGVLIAALVGAGLIVFGLAFLLYLPSISSGGGSGGGFIRPPAEVDFPAPKLYLSDLEGKAVSLEKFRGQVVLLNNWATWCPPCKEEMPELEAYYRSHAKQGFVVIAVDAGDNVGEVKAFAQDYGLTFVVWPDMLTKTIRAFENDNLPSSYLIDRDGTVRLVWVGAVNRATLEKYVTPYLEE